MADAKKLGKVKWFNTQKGFGFITPDDGSEEIFVHQTAIHAEGFRSLKEGEAVEFNTDTSEDGRPKAVNVTGPSGGVVEGAPRRMYPFARAGGRGRGEGAAGEGAAGEGRGAGRGRGRGRGRGGRGRGGGRGAGRGAPAADGAVPTPAAPPAPVAAA